MGSSWEWDLSQDMHHFTGSQSVTIYSAEMTPDRSYAFVSGTYEPTGDAMQKWVAETWTALYNAAQATFYSSQQSRVKRGEGIVHAVRRACPGNLDKGRTTVPT